MGLFRSTRTMYSTSNMSGMGRPEYNRRIGHLRRVEYPMLEGRTYLDHAGTALTCKSLLTTFSQEMQRYLLANPHSAISSRPSDSEKIVSNTRLKVLDMFKADPEHFDVVFVANATAGIKLVMEGFSGHKEGYNYYYHRDCHTSLVGVRELAYQSHCFASDEETKTWIDTGNGSLERGNDIRSTLFAYPGQSNLNGRRLPLDWSSQIRSSEEHRNTYTLLDAAALITTSPIDLSDHNAAPDFVVLSFYKIFGFPDLGALLVRKASAHVLDHRKYFGGGTTEMITCIGDPWVVRKNTSIHARWEDGTGAIRSQLALSCALDVHQQLYGGLAEVSKHVSWLAQHLYQKLSAIQHSNGLPVCCIYKDPASTYGDPKTQGGTVALNLRRSDGTWFSGWECGAIAIARNIHVRTGAMCNPAGAACALGLTAHELQKAFDSGFRCNQKLDVRNGIPMGMVRVSLGAISTLEDIDVFVKFVEECFVDEKLERSDGDSRTERNPSSEVGEMSGGYHEEDPRLKPANTKPEDSYQSGAFASLSRFKFGRLKILRTRWKAFRCLG